MMNNHSHVGNGHNHVIFDEAVDLEPIDFEHFVDDEAEANAGSSNDNNRMFRMNLGSSPPTRGR